MHHLPNFPLDYLHLGLKALRKIQRYQADKSANASEPVNLLTPVSAAVLSHTRFGDSFIPDFFSSMQKWYMFSIRRCISIKLPHWSRFTYALYIETCFLFLQICKCPASLWKQKKRILLGIEPSTLLSDSLSTTVIVLPTSYDHVYILWFVNIKINTLGWHIQQSDVVLKTIWYQLVKLSMESRWQ